MTPRSWILAVAAAATFIIAACTMPAQTAPNSQGTATNEVTNNTTTNGTE
jgi:outer membrane biogenesis lipoprotein LolB